MDPFDRPVKRVHENGTWYKQQDRIYSLEAEVARLKQEAFDRELSREAAAGGNTGYVEKVVKEKYEPQLTEMRNRMKVLEMLLGDRAKR